MEVIVHIGVHKTGTSAIQSFLAKNADKLSDCGVFYSPRPLDGCLNHHPIATAFDKSLPSPGIGEDRVAALLSAAKGRKVLISSEVLCEVTTDVDRFLETLKGHKVSVIAYLRHPCDIVISAFNERVRHHGRPWTTPINDLPLAYDPSQLEMLERWLARDDISVTLAPHDRNQWPGGSLFLDFLKMIGVSPEGFDLQERRENVSTPYALADLLRLFNSTNPTKAQHDEFLSMIRRLEIHEGGEFPLLPSTVETCLRAMEATLPIYRPFLRGGFSEGYLTDQRPLPGRKKTSSFISRLQGAWPHRFR